MQHDNAPALARLFARCLQADNGCLLWTGAQSDSGYGHIKHNNRTVLIHRHVMRLLGHNIDGKTILHKCDQPLCIEPSHLVVGTQADNVRDCIDKGRRRSLVGEANYHAKLTPEAVKAIRQAEQPRRQLANQYQVSINAISRIVNMQTWTHI